MCAELMDVENDVSTLFHDVEDLRDEVNFLKEQNAALAGSVQLLALVTRSVAAGSSQLYLAVEALASDPGNPFGAADRAMEILTQSAEPVASDATAGPEDEEAA